MHDLSPKKFLHPGNAYDLCSLQPSRLTLPPTSTILAFEVCSSDGQGSHARSLASSGSTPGLTSLEIDMTDEPEDTAPPTEHQVRMANVDAALAPAVKAADNIGVISYHHMKQILTCVRQAIAVAFDPPVSVF